MPWYFFTSGGTPRVIEEAADIPIGQMLMFAGPMSGTDGSESQAKTAPDGFLFCNGAEVQQSEFPLLFAAIGTKFGTASSPSTHFVLPDLLSAIPVGIDSGDTDFDAIGDTGGSSGHAHTLPSHTHPFADHIHALEGHTHLMNNHTHSVPHHVHGAGGLQTTSNSSSHRISNNSSNVTVAPVFHSHDIDGSTGNVSSNQTSTGPSTNTTTSQDAVTTSGGSTSGTQTTGPLDAADTPVTLNLPSQGDDNYPPYISFAYVIKV